MSYLNYIFTSIKNRGPGKTGLYNINSSSERISTNCKPGWWCQTNDVHLLRLLRRFSFQFSPCYYHSSWFSAEAQWIKDNTEVSLYFPLHTINKNIIIFRCYLTCNTFLKVFLNISFCFNLFYFFKCYTSLHTKKC